MSLPPLPAAAQELLARPNPAVMATVRSDGAPVTTPTWYLWDEETGRALLNFDEGRVRLRHLRRTPEVSLTVLDGEDWYTHVTLIGTVSAMRADEGLTDIDKLSRHYTGDPYPERLRSRVSAWLEVERWHGWGAHRDSNQASV